MLEFEREEIEQILTQLEQQEALFPDAVLTKEGAALRTLGWGSFSVVYEMRSAVRGDAYALKVSGFQRFGIPAEEFRTAAAAQQMLMTCSKYVVPVRGTKELWLKMTKDNHISEVRTDAPGEEGYLAVQFVLMDKLEEIIEKDKFGNVSLKREVLKQQPEILKLGMEIGQALQQAHSHHILHRDIKLENILWDPRDGCYKLGDFGSCKYTADGQAETVIFTNGYGAPEIQRMLTNRYDSAADIYSFGITLYLLLNDLKFPGSEGYRCNLVQYHPDFVFPAPEHASESVARVVRKMCSYRKSERYTSMEEILAALSYAGDNSLPDKADPAWEADIPTELYRTETDTDAPSEEEKNSRAQYLHDRRIRRKTYSRHRKLLFIGLAFLIYFGVPLLQAEEAVAASWNLWLISGALLLQWLFLRIGDLRKLAGLGAICLIVLAAKLTALSAVHILAILFILCSVPLPLLAFFAAMQLWNVFPCAHPAVSWLREHYGVYLLLIVLYGALCHHMLSYVKYHDAAARLPVLGVSMMIWLPYVLMAGGAILWGVDLFSLVSLPQGLTQYNWFIVGIGSFLCLCCLSKEWDAVEQVMQANFGEVASVPHEEGSVAE